MSGRPRFAALALLQSVGWLRLSALALTYTLAGGFRRGLMPRRFGSAAHRRSLGFVVATGTAPTDIAAAGELFYTNEHATGQPISQLNCRGIASLASTF